MRKNILLFSFFILTLTFMVSSCKKDEIKGCTNPAAANFDPDATEDSGNCIINGCTNPDSENYNPDATADDGSCIVNGCNDPEALNFNSEANTDDGSCTYKKDLFIGVFKGTMECDYELLNDYIGGQDLTFTIIEIPGENDKVTVDVDFEIDILAEKPIGTIGDDKVLRFSASQKGLEIDVLGTGTPQLVDIYTDGEFTIDEETMQILSGTINIEVQSPVVDPPLTILESECLATAIRQ